MAPKRKAGTKQVAKKAKIEEVPKTEYDLKLEKVIDALRNEDYPIEGGESNREMLILGAPCVFEEFAENRHENQGTMSGFIDEAFAGIRRSLEEKCAEQARIQETAESRRTELVAASETATTTLTEREAAWETTKATLAEKKEAWTEAKTGLKTAKTDQKDIDAELGAAQADCDKFTSGRTMFITLRDQGPEKAMLKDIKPILGDLKLEGKNTEAYTILSRELTARGMFDKMVMDHVAAKFETFIGESTARITEITTRGASFIAATAAADAKATECATIVEGAENAVAEAKTAVTEAKATLKEADKAIVTHDNDVASAETRKVECENNLMEFSLIEDALNWLKVRTVPVPEPEIIEDDKPAETADVEMAPTAEPTAESTEAPIAEETMATEAPIEPVVEEPIIEEPAMDVPMEPMAA